MGIWRYLKQRNALWSTWLCGVLILPNASSAIDVWQAGASGVAWGEVGELTGLTTDGSSLLPAVVDSTTNALQILQLKRRGGSISSPQASNVDLTGLLTDGSRETFWRVERERRPDGTSMIVDLGAILPIIAFVSRAAAKPSYAPMSSLCTTAIQISCAKIGRSPLSIRLHRTWSKTVR